MKAIVYTQYGSPDVLQLREVEKPDSSPAEEFELLHEIGGGVGPHLSAPESRRAAKGAVHGAPPRGGHMVEGEKPGWIWKPVKVF